jgi:plastocyanin
VVTRREWIGAIAMLASLSLARAADADAAPPTHTIEMRNMRFGPIPGNIKAGDRIIWVNRDIVAHTATAVDDSFDVEVPSGGSVTTVAGSAGKVPFYCRYHPGMRGELVISR